VAREPRFANETGLFHKVRCGHPACHPTPAFIPPSSVVRRDLPQRGADGLRRLLIHPLQTVGEGLQRQHGAAVAQPLKDSSFSPGLPQYWFRRVLGKERSENGSEALQSLFHRRRV
jgi:hypothetical protein